VRVRRLRSYQLYGLRLSSVWPLPAPEIAYSDAPDVTLCEGTRSFFRALAIETSAPPAVPGAVWKAPRSDGSTYLRWAGLFDFLISAGGRTILGCPAVASSIEAFSTFLLGQVLSYALLNQGLEPLHATVVVVDGVAIGFIGDSGYGKSSLAAAFLRAGHRLLTDDLLLLKRDDSGFCGYPGPPRIKLFPDVARRFLGASVNGTPMTRLTTKLVIPLARRQVHGAPAQVRALYALREPATKFSSVRIAVRRMSRRRACLKLLANTFNSSVAGPARLHRQLVFASEVAGSIPVKSLSYPRRLGSLPALRDAILADLSG
jgi:hypothetical protein